MKLKQLKKIVGEHKRQLRQRYGMKEIGVFGSYVRGEQKAKSDLDILVEFKKDAEIDLLEFVNMGNHLSELLGVKVDLVQKSSLKPRIGKHILKEVVYL